ncbi:hypothetical protein ACOMHN_006000 [Nucella lapillus]
MPRVQDPLTLKQTCTNVIAHHFDRLWGEDFNSQFGNMPSRLMHVIGPFNDLPGHICEDIFQTLEKSHMLRSSHLHLLLMPQTTHVRFVTTSAASLINEALKLLSYRCKKLVCLDLSDCRFVSPQSIAKCLPSLPALKSLILTYTKANSAVLKSVATCLPHLTNLDLRGCPVTDSDALLLCGDGGNFEPVCKNLVRLNLTGTKVELRGCIAILQCFPNLRMLLFPDTMEAVAQLHKNDAPAPNSTDSAANRERSCGPSTSGGSSVSERNTSVPENCHKLEKLFSAGIRCGKIKSDSVQLACSYCPYARDVSWLYGASDESLKHLESLPHLNALEVCGDPCGVSFHGGIKPLLVSRGAEMRELGLFDILSVDLGMVGCMCPQLQHLKVFSMSLNADFAQSYVTAKQQAESFKALRYFMMVLGSSDIQFVPSDVLMCAKNLQTLHMLGVANLTDQVLEAAFEAHGFLCLKELELDTCNQVTVSSVTKLVTCCDQLTHVTLNCCDLITLQDVEELDLLISAEGLDVTVKWK